MQLSGAASSGWPQWWCCVCLALLVLLAPPTGDERSSGRSGDAASFCTFVDASFFVRPAGIEIDQTMRIPNIADVVDALQELDALQVQQSAILLARRARLDDLTGSEAVLHANFDLTYARVQQQLVEAASQRALQHQQASELSSLQSYDDANTANVSRIDSDAILLAGRTAAVEAATLQMAADLDTLNTSFAQANHTATEVHSPLLSGLFVVTSSQTVAIASLQMADEVIGANLTEIAADAAALRARVTQNELAAIALTNQQAETESTMITVTSRIGAIEAALIDIAAVEANHTASIAEIDALTTTQTVQIASILTDDAALQSDVSLLQRDDASHTARTVAAQSAASLLTTRVTNAEDVIAGTSTLVDTVLTLRPRYDILDAAVISTLSLLSSVNSTVLQLAAAANTNIGGVDKEVTIRQNTTLSLVQAAYANISEIPPPLDLYTQRMIGAQSPRLHRYTFLTSQQWTVPAGVSSAFVTMAGGGGSGYGWRVRNAMASGHSGGYVFKAPIQLTAGENISITVGKGAISYQPYRTYTTSQQETDVYKQPSGDDGLSGYPGSASEIISPSGGTLLRCDGGSGATPSNIVAYDLTSVAGAFEGARVTTGTETATISPTNRPATGPYVTSGGPGACGTNGYGIGNAGHLSMLGTSEFFSGGTTPFGYGSGGSVSLSGCYVTTTTIGGCIFPLPGTDGVVFIDVLY